jgi:Tol biopolymer transport system component
MPPNALPGRPRVTHAQEKPRLARATPAAFAVATLAALALALASPAGAACEAPLPGGDPLLDDRFACGPITSPSVSGVAGGITAPSLVLWTSGYDLNPLNGNRSGIWIARIDGTQRRRLVPFERVNRDFEEHGLNLPDDHPSFSPDSRKVVFTSNRANRSNWDIYVMNVNGTGISRLTSTAGLDTEPVFSPDGTRIAFATERFGKLEIAVMNANGTNVRRVTTNSVEDIEPAWRPDGQEIAFSRVFGEGQKGVFAIKPDGTGERLVANSPGEDHDPSYSPDGRQMVITSERPPFSPPYGNVYKVDAATGAAVADLTADQDFAAGDPFWSRDGKHIAYFKSGTRFLRGPQQLFVMDRNGANKFQVPGEALANIHPAMGVAVDDDGDGTPNYLESGSVGKARLSPRRVRARRTELVRFAWKHPGRWRDLDTMSLRISSDRWLLGAVRFSIRDRTLSLFDGLDDRYTNGRRLGGGRLRSSLLTLNVERSRAIGVDRKRLRLVLALRFHPRIAGHGFRLVGRRLRARVQANDRGGRNQEEELGHLTILRPR